MKDGKTRDLWLQVTQREAGNGKLWGMVSRMSVVDTSSQVSYGVAEKVTCVPTGPEEQSESENGLNGGLTTALTVNSEWMAQP